MKQIYSLPRIIYESMNTTKKHANEKSPEP